MTSPPPCPAENLPMLRFTTNHGARHCAGLVALGAWAWWPTAAANRDEAMAAGLVAIATSGLLLFMAALGYLWAVVWCGDLFGKTA